MHSAHVHGTWLGCPKYNWRKPEKAHWSHWIDEDDVDCKTLARIRGKFMLMQSIRIALTDP